MLAKALIGSKRYYAWVIFLLIVIGVGTLNYLYQLQEGLHITGMSRDVSWGFYIAQFTFLVGVAASAVMVVLPYYLHSYKHFGKITALGEFLAVSAVVMCMLFIFVDMGRPDRVLNVMLHPTLHSVMFWDMVVLTGYLILNITIGYTSMSAARKECPPPFWVKPLVYISIPWAVSIHTVTAFLYAGLPGRHMWLTAIMAARFLASAFASGPALLILLVLLLKRVTKFDAGVEAVQKVAQIVTYAMIINVFFLLLEFFTAFYSGIPAHKQGLEYLFFGLHGYNHLVPWMWVGAVLAIFGILLLLNPNTRKQESYLVVGCISIFIAAWIDKGLGLVLGGFVPTPFERITEYTPTAPELAITIGVYGVGFLILTILYKIATAVREELDAR